jgi:glycolate oxidase FAD binding subunit
MPDEPMAQTISAERVTCHSVEQVVDAVRAAHADRAPLRITSGASWLDAGLPVAAERVLDLAPLSGVTEYVPGDLTLTAHAGTTLDELAEVTARHRQWLPFDPFGDPRGTLGATLATASTGPLAGSIGHPRDGTVGLSFVTGTGDVVQGGGRVVKNVAGFDLVRLAIGAWGTLGVITEATVRLRARPEADETVVMQLPVEPDALATLLSNVRVAMVEPIAAELLSPACAAGIGLGLAGVMLVRLAGNAVGVHHQRATLAKLAPCAAVGGEVWTKLRRSDPADAVVVRVSRRPSELARLWLGAMTVPGVDAHATLARGIVRLRLTSESFPANALDGGDRVIYESAPPGRRAGATGEVHDVLSRRLRDAFDPRRILNRGILGPDPTT